jgi:hypothetical protein
MRVFDYVTNGKEKMKMALEIVRNRREIFLKTTPQRFSFD